MLYRYCSKFLEHRSLANFSDRSIQDLDIRLGEFRSFARTRKPRSKRISNTYKWQSSRQN
jgi:hypothetical protein